MRKHNTLLVKRLGHFLAILLAGIAISACSGGSDQAPNNSLSVRGQAIKGIIANADIFVLDSATRQPLTTSQTDDQGLFTVALPSPLASTYLLELRSNDTTRMRCDSPQGCENNLGEWQAFGEWITLPNNFRLLGFINPSLSTRVNLSPFSHIIAGTAASLPGGITTENLAIASEWVADSFKLVLSLHSDWPDVTQASSIMESPDRELALAIYSAAFMQLPESFFGSEGAHLDDLPLYELVSEAAEIASALGNQLGGSNASRMEQLASQANGYATSLYNAPLQITAQPLSQIVNEGQGVMLRVNAQSGDGNLRYQWYRDGQIITGATGSTLSIASATLSDTGTYYVSISDVDEQLQSNTALLTVNEIIDPVVITTQPSGTTVTEGQAINLSVQVSGDGPFSYQWQKGGSLIPGATQSSLLIANSQLQDAGSYRVIISNAVSEVPSAYVNVVVTQAATPVSIQSQPESRTARIGEDVSFNVSATGSGFISYQWFKNGVALSNANQSQLRLTTIDESAAGNYYVRVSNSLGSLQSATASLTVTTDSVDIQILSHPVSIQLAPGESTNLAVAANSSQTLSYQWLFNGLPISGANSPTHAINNASELDAGLYRVRISTADQSVESNSAMVSISALPSLQLSWDIPSHREDGSELPLYEIDGYRIEYGYSPNQYSGQVLINEATTTSYLLEDLSSGTLYLRIATIDSDGRLGEFSAPISVSL